MQVLSPSSSCDPDRQYGKFKVVSVGFSFWHCCTFSMYTAVYFPVNSAKLEGQLQLAYALHRFNQKAAMKEMTSVESEFL